MSKKKCRKLEENKMSKGLLSKCLDQLTKDIFKECGWSVNEFNISINKKIPTKAADFFNSFLFMKIIENPSISFSDSYVYFDMNEVKKNMEISQHEVSILVRNLASISLTIVQIQGIEFSISNVFPEYNEILRYPDEEKSAYGYRLFLNSGFKSACLEVAEQEHINITEDH